MFRFEDMLVILAVGLVLFGPNKLVDFAKSLGTAFTEFKKAANPEGHNVPAVQTQSTLAHQPVPVPVAKAPARRGKSTTAKKKVKAAS